MSGVRVSPPSATLNVVLACVPPAGFVTVRAVTERVGYGSRTTVGFALRELARQRRLRTRLEDRGRFAVRLFARVEGTA